MEKIFYFLTFALKTIPIAVVYASWAGLGVFSVAILSSVFYKEVISFEIIVGLFFIVVGVTLINIYKE